jgi:hypothetical protein
MAEEVKTPAQANPEAVVESRVEPPKGDAVKTAAAVIAEPASPPPPAKTVEAPVEELVLVSPEGTKLQATDVDKIASFAKEHGLSKDAAQALLEHESTVVAAREQAQLDHLKAQSDAWKDEVLNDKEMGGDKAKENVELAHRFAKTFWDDNFLDELEKTGLGNHPGLMKGFYRAGKAMAPDKMRGSGNPTGTGKRSTEEVLYGKKP